MERGIERSRWNRIKKHRRLMANDSVYREAFYQQQTQYQYFRDLANSEGHFCLNSK